MYSVSICLYIWHSGKLNGSHLALSRALRARRPLLLPIHRLLGKNQACQVNSEAPCRSGGRRARPWVGGGGCWRRGRPGSGLKAHYWGSKGAKARSLVWSVEKQRNVTLLFRAGAVQALWLVSGIFRFWALNALLHLPTLPWGLADWLRRPLQANGVRQTSSLESHRSGPCVILSRKGSLFSELPMSHQGEVHLGVLWVAHLHFVIPIFATLPSLDKTHNFKKKVFFETWAMGWNLTAVSPQQGNSPSGKVEFLNWIAGNSGSVGW